jgi:hypothetical protein
MSLTIAQVESVLIARRGPAMVACDLSANPLSDASPRLYLRDPLVSGLEMMGYATDDPAQAMDADLAGLARTEYRCLKDCAELRVLETCLGNFVDVDYTEGRDGRKLQQLRADLIVECARKEAQIRASYPNIPFSNGGR